MEVKDIIKQKRLERGLTLDEVARLVGVSGGTISRWESGDIANMKRDKIVSLANALGISPAVIMGWEEPAEEEYYINPETAQLAQELYENKDMRILFDAAQGVPPSAILAAADLLSQFKKTNQDG